jgi:excisionase family DNA binding protein
MAKKNLPDLLTIQQSADYLGTSRQAIYEALDKGWLKEAARYGRTGLIARADLVAFKKSRRPRGPAPTKKPPKR